MAAPKGNTYWLARSSHGRKPKYTPEKLLDAAYQYFEWIEKNPYKEVKYFTVDKKLVKRSLNKKRPPTIFGLCRFCDIETRTFERYQKQEDFSRVCTHILQCIADEKFSGAAAGHFNHAIIARDLGLADKRELSGDGGSPIQVESKVLKADMDQAQAQRLYKEMMSGD